MTKIDSLADIRPGDLLFGPIHGAAGALVAAGQLSLAAIEPGFLWRTGVRDWFGIRHVLVVTEAVADWPMRPKAVQAMPHGAEEIELTRARHWTHEYVYVRPAYRKHGFDTVLQGELVARAARSYIGTKYNFATYAAIPAHRLHIPVPRLDRYIASSKRMICSQLADQAMADARWHNFNDGRLPQDVTPFELFREMIGQEGVLITTPPNPKSRRVPR